MSHPFDALVFIGRFQPFHSGHLAVVRHALSQSDRVLLLCGSARQPRSTRNPWTFDQVVAMVRACLTEEESDRVILAPVMDHLYNEAQWVRLVQQSVADRLPPRGPHQGAARLGLIGLASSGANYFPSRFPQWPAVPFRPDNGVRSTQIREALFGLGPAGAPSGPAYLQSAAAGDVLPEPVRRALLDYCVEPAYLELKAEAEFLAKYRAAWSAAPYPPIFVTVDAVVVQSGHILLIERRARPGRGLWALPGGFLDPGETLEDACLRELREETRLKVPAPVLRGSIRERRVFDAPHRSERGRTLTHAYHIELAPAPELPKVKGGDDARHAFWLPLAQLEPERLFEDHYFIIQAMLG
jgi:bifunctional NMN adenylyltransferase/nudix hydrolase